jgi:hypothetical protein
MNSWTGYGVYVSELFILGHINKYYSNSGVDYGVQIGVK